MRGYAGMAQDSPTFARAEEDDLAKEEVFFQDAGPSRALESGDLPAQRPPPGRPGRRECTDVGCLMLLLAFLYGLWLIYAHSRAAGDLAKLTHGFDWKGDICGVDPGVESTPLLFWCAPSAAAQDVQLLDGICVERCPSGAQSSNWCPGAPAPIQRESPVMGSTKKVLIGMIRNLTVQADYPTTEALGYCFPQSDVLMMRRIMNGTHVSTLTKQIFLACSGALQSWRFLIGVAALCVCIGYAFLALLYCCFARLVYGLVAVVHVLLILSSAALIYAGFHEEHNFFVSYATPSTSRMLAWACGGFALTLWFLFAALCCYSRGAISVTIDSVKATCEVIARIPTMLLQPLLHSIVVVGVLLSLLYGLAWVLSTGKVVPDGEPLKQGGVEISGLHRNIEFTSLQWGMLTYWVFGLIWIFETVNALGQFAISHSVVMHACFGSQEWFPMLRGYFAGMCFHVGTLAYGGFIIGCLKIIAAVLAFLARQAWDQSAPPSCVTRLLCCCCAQCTAIIERVLTMVNDLVYTDVALRAVGYIDAAQHVVRIAASSPATYVAIKSSATAVRVLGVTTIGGLGTFLSYQVLASSSLHRELDAIFDNASSMLVTSNILGTTIASSLVCFYIALAFMMVFYQTTYTLMYCMLIGAVSTSDGDEALLQQQREMRHGFPDKL